VVILHAFLALSAGFATMALLIAILTGLLKKLTPSWTGAQSHLSVGYGFVNFGCSILAAAAGGYITAWLALNNPLLYVLALAITVLLLGALSAVQQRGRLPIWYLLLLTAITPLGALAGGLIRLRVLGIL
jgi:hypothetical protein